MKTLFLLRGLPGSGKTTLAEMLGVDRMFAADDFFYDDEGNYNFNIGQLHRAHTQCMIRTEDALRSGLERVAVHNTFTTERELRPYLDLARNYNYRVVSLVVENRHGGVSVHDVPEETLDKMRRRFSVQL